MKITLIQIRQEPQCLPEYIPILRPYQNTVYLGDQHCVCRWPGIHGGRTSTGSVKITLIQIRQEPQCLPEYIPILRPYQNTVYLGDQHCVCRWPGIHGGRTSTGTMKITLIQIRQEQQCFPEYMPILRPNQNTVYLGDQHCVCRWPGIHGGRTSTGTMKITPIQIRQEPQCLPEYMSILRPNQNTVYLGDQHCVCRWPGIHGGRTSTGTMKITPIQIRQEQQCLPEYMPILRPNQNTVYLGDQHCVCRWPGIHGGRTSTGTMKITLIQIRQEPQCLPEYMPILTPNQNTVYLGDQHCVCRWPGIHGGRTSTGTMKITLIQIRQEPQCLPEYMPILTPNQNTVYLGDQHCVCRWPGIHGGRASTGTMKITPIQIRQEPQCLSEYMPILRPNQNTVHWGDQHCVCRWPDNHRAGHQQAQ